MNKEDLYTEDEIILIDDLLKNLKDKILMDDHQEFFILKDFNIKSITTKEFRLFKPNVEVQQFYINTITIGNGAKDYVHQDDAMCTTYGINSLMNYRLNYFTLEKNLIKFTLNNGISLKFGGLTVSKPNDSSNFKRR